MQERHANWGAKVFFLTPLGKPTWSLGGCPSVPACAGTASETQLLKPHFSNSAPPHPRARQSTKQGVQTDATQRREGPVRREARTPEGNSNKVGKENIPDVQLSRRELSVEGTGAEKQALGRVTESRAGRSGVRTWEAGDGTLGIFSWVRQDQQNRHHLGMLGSFLCPLRTSKGWHLAT